MSTPNRPASRKLHSVHVLPDGRDFSGKIEAGKVNYLFTFSPETAKVVDRKLVLSGTVSIKSPAGQKRLVEGVTATLLATQSNASPAPPAPRNLDRSLIPVTSAYKDLPVVTEATGEQGSVGVMYLKLSTLDTKQLGVPIGIGSVQLNARLHPTSEIERDLQWLYSALVRSTLGETLNEQAASGFLAEINRILKA